MRSNSQIWKIFFVSVFALILQFGCDEDPPPGPEPITCPEAQEAVNAACCGLGPGHGTAPGVPEGSVTYEDCLTGQMVTLTCANASDVIEDQTIEEAPVQLDVSADCESAIEEAKTVCPGYEPAEANAIECPEEPGSTVLLNCEDLQAIADSPNRCSNINLRGWEPVTPAEAQGFRDRFHTDADDVTLSIPPPASTHNDGTAPPDLTTELGYPNDLVRSLRLEIPGNFIRYHLAEGPLRYGFQKANEMDGVSCDPNTLRCSINPLALIDLTDKIPQDGDLTFDFQKIEIDGQVAWRVKNLKYESIAPPVIIAWDGAVDVQARPVVIDLKQKTRLSLLPLHSPNDGLGPDGSNSYSLTDIKFPDRQKNMLDQALIVTNLDATTCWSFVENPSYLTFSQPVKCNCPTEPGGKGYCVTELYPRDVVQTALLQYAVNTDYSFLALCNDPLRVKSAPYKNLFALAAQGADPDLSNKKVTTPFFQHFNSNAAGQITVPIQAAYDDVVQFGCSGRLSKYAEVGLQVTQSFGTYTGTIGEGASSSAGIELATSVEMGGLMIDLIPGEARFSMGVLAQFEEWVKKRYKSFLAWFLKWIVRLLGGTVNIDVAILLPSPGLPNAASLRLDPLDIKIHGVLSQVSQNNVDGLEIGTRRIQTNLPRIDEDDWKLEVKWDAANCKNIFASNQSLLDRFKSIIGCPLDLIEGFAALVLGPVTTFLGKEMLEVFVDLTDKLNDMIFDTVVKETAKMEEGNILAILLQDSAEQFFFEPYYVQPMGDPVKAAVGTLPAGLALACGAAPNPSIACALAHLMVGNGMVETSAKVEILRVGAKTHYRSMDAFDARDPSFCFPPVRYCVVGDNPSGAPVFDADDRRATQDFDEVDVAEQGGLDWHHQCAMFVDFSPQAVGHIVTPTATYEIGVWPSKRTEYLINEIFVCRNSAHCHPASEPNFLAQRAELAACSILGDIWGHVAGSNDPYLNELILLTTVTDPVGLAALKGVWDVFLKNSDLGDEFNSFDELVDFAATCKTKLIDAGFPAPEASRPATIFNTIPEYECAASYFP